MGSKLKTNFVVQTKFEPFYVAGKIEVSRDGHRIFTSSGNSVKVFNVENGVAEKTIQTEESDQISQFLLNPVNEHLITASRNLLVREWSWTDSTCLKTWKAVHHSPISCMAFDSTGELLATGSGDATIKIWHSVLKCHTHSFRGSSGVVSVLKFHPDAKRGLLVSTSDDYLIRIWNLNPAKLAAALEGHFSAVSDIQFADDGLHLISAGRDKVLILWSLSTSSQIKTVPVFEEIERFIVLPASSAFPEFNTPEGPFNVLTGGARGVLSVWDLKNGRNLHPGSLPSESDAAVADHKRIIQLHFDRPSRRLFVVTVDQSILLYDLPNLKPSHQFSGYNDEVFDVKFVGDDRFAVVATNSPRLKLYNVTTADCKFADGHTESVLCVAVFHQSNLVVTGSKDCDIRLWRFSESKGSLKCVASASGHTSTVGALACSNSSKHPFIVSGSEDSTMKIWTVQQDKSDKRDSFSLHCIHTEVAHDKGINSVALSPDDKWIASAGGDKTAKVWKKEPFGLKGVLRGHRKAVWCVVFAPHDQIIGTSSGDGTIKLWTVSDLRCIKTFEGHDCSVMKVAFLSRGLQLLSSGSDGLLKLWDVRKNICTKTFDEHDDKVWAVEVSQDESKVLTGAGDSTFLLWKDVTEQELDEERQKQDTLIQEEQELQNLLQKNEFAKAFRLALRLDQPGRLLNIISGMLETETGQMEIKVAVRALEDFQLEQLLQYIVIWNTNSRHTYPAQCTLNCVFTSILPKRLLGLPKIKTLVESLIPYTERHASRLDQLHVSSMTYKYLSNNVKKLSELPSKPTTQLPVNGNIPYPDSASMEAEEEMV
ncbi:Transducin beta-like protein 3 [Hypsibius exemplaris]|uniref:Transducin beta-like protein 3 n=1 Tax=Hypsibius exemplaris TaxID=2072580 RepID=A0A1W0WMW1_HYPEX|nr:Transducin beta-like protein 3 [Hypsibius exemplaris]